MGNSFFYYNNSMHNHFGRLVASAPSGSAPARRPRSTSVTISGSGLQSVFHATVKKHAQALERAAVRPVLFMSWAYKDKPEMTAQLAEQYTLAGNANNALVIPAGLAFAKAIAKQPQVELYEADKRHPSLAGTYLAACTAFAALYRQSPVGLAYTAGLPPDLVKLLQTSAWETAQEYFGS